MKKLILENSMGRRIVGKVGKIVLGIVIIILVGVAFLTGILLLRSKGEMKQFEDSNGRILKGSLSEKGYVTINDAKMGMIIKSKDITNPVLLFVHGGPGMPEYPLIGESSNDLADYFTVVWWDQRGAGLSYSSDISKDTMTTEQFISDTVEVTNYLRKRFSKEKIYLMGHSWGTFIAIQAAAKAPELYHAYIGMGQITNQMESERLAYDYMLDYYDRKGDRNALKRLKSVSLSTSNNLPDEYLSMRDELMHRCGIGTTHKMRSVVTGIFVPVMWNQEYTLGEKINIWKGKAFSNTTNLRQEMYDTDIPKCVTELKIPVYFFSGLYDYTVNYQMAKEYMNKLKAPIKGFYLFKESAHSPFIEESEKVLNIMVNDVLKGRNELAEEID
ncbi:MAG TPA: alpha/beta hydrolase [Lachnospiraceae bacterium]|nr:alpha/beta hydrolase [Lachnospiraceae bacterium]